MAPMPDLNTTALEELPSLTEAYFNDHFGFRNTFIRRYRKFEEHVFGRRTSKILQGSPKEWYFFVSSQEIDDFLGNAQFSPEELTVWEQAFTTRTSFLATKKIPYICMIPPDKSKVYPEHLPEHIQTNRGKSRLEQLTNHLNQTTGFKLNYLLEKLLSAKNQDEVYFPGDTHWNYRGCYVGYLSLVEKLSQFYPSITPISLESCTFETNSRLADLAGTLAGKNEQIVLHHPIPPNYNLITIQEDPNLAGSHWTSTLRRTPAHYHNPNGSGTLLLIHDSFFEQGIQTLLPLHFEHTYLFWMYAEAFELMDMVERLKPDVVIEMRVERSLRLIPGQRQKNE